MTRRRNRTDGFPAASGSPVSPQNPPQRAGFSPSRGAGLLPAGLPLTLGSHDETAGRRKGLSVRSEGAAGTLCRPPGAGGFLSQG